MLQSGWPCITATVGMLGRIAAAEAGSGAALPVGGAGAFDWLTLLLILGCVAAPFIVRYTRL